MRLTKHRSHHFAWLTAIILALSMTVPALGQGNISINSASASCNGVNMGLTLSGFPTGSSQTLLIDVYAGGTRIVATERSVQITGTNSNHSPSVSFSQQPDGTSIYISVDIAGQDSQQRNIGPCSNNAPSGGGGGSSASASTAAGPPWSGSTDGRLSPDPAEAYSVWCAYDRVFVYGMNPNGDRRIVINMDLNTLLNLNHMQEFTVDNTMRISRQQNVIVIQGSNSYYAPQWRSKTFDLNDCLTRNAANSGSSNLVLNPPSNAQSAPSLGVCYNTIEALQRANAAPSALCPDGPSSIVVGS